MKKHLLYAFLVATSLVFYSCEEQENITFDNVNGQTMVQFTGNAVTLPVEPTGVSSTDITVTVTTVSNQDRTLSLEIDASSTATANQYSLTDIIIPAGEYSGTGQLTGNYANIPATGQVSVVINLTGIQGATTTQSNAVYTVLLERFCPLVITDFYGTYAQLGGFDGAAPGARVDATVSAGPVPGTLRIDDLYSSGRGAVIELDYSDTANPRVIHRSEEFGVVFQVAGLGNTYTEDVLGDVDKNIFSPCNNEIRLFFYRRIQQPDGRYYGGSYEVILTKR